MHATTDRLEFSPPPTSGVLRALGLAILAHAFLLAALTWGVHWKRDAVNVSAEAELWAAIPQQAAPKPVEVTPSPEWAVRARLCHAVTLPFYRLPARPHRPKMRRHLV